MIRHHKTVGFSLVELLVVLGILAMSMVVIPPMVSSVIGSSEIKNATRNIAAALRLGRSTAVMTQQETAFVLNVQNRHYSVADKDRQLNLPDETQIKLIAAESEMLSEHEGAVRFFPDGSSTGGRITLAGASTEYIVDVNWLTGGITISP